MPTNLLNDEELADAIGPHKDTLKELLPTVVEAEFGCPLQRSGENLITVCRFDGCSDDKKPSFNVYRRDDGQWAFKCFSCGAAGDVFVFLQKTKKLNFLDAYMDLAKGTYGLPTSSPQKRDELKKPNVSMEKRETILTVFTGLAHQFLTDENREYIHRRKISNHTIDRLKIGSFSSIGRLITSLEKIGKQKDFSIADCIAIGLFHVTGDDDPLARPHFDDDFVTIPVWRGDKAAGSQRRLERLTSSAGLTPSGCPSSLTCQMPGTRQCGTDVRTCC